MSNNKLRLGKFGETIAAKYLSDKGYEIVVQNYHTRDGEVDLICQKNEVIHFIEVKTRTNQNFGWPEEAVTDQKLEKISLAAERYLVENKINSEWQIDIVSILINKKTKLAKIKYFNNVNN